ncbi:endopeptidase La [Desulfuromonas sp. TF]|uniref:endopeptidase La n=1 Tax=Desulfuromonas sp. TF TaxID=1232410 RepID=UPI0009E058CA|nr:endopeptidase La [Desulfuromonas sp. TF]
MNGRHQPIPQMLPIYPMREQVMFPHMVFPLFIQPDEMPLIEEAMRSDHLLGLVMCSSNHEPLVFQDLAKVGTVCRINQVFRFPEGGCKVVVEGIKRIRLVIATQMSPFIIAKVNVTEEQDSGGLVSEALVQSVNALLKIALAYGRPLPGDVVKMIDQIEDAGRLADLVAVYLNLPVGDQQRLLEILDPLERLKEVYLHLTSEVQKLQVRGEIQSDLAKRIGRTQKEYLLREQMKQIQEELGDEDPRQAEINEFRKRIEKVGMPDNVKSIAEKELGRLERINPASPEYTVARTYLEYLCTVPWSRGTQDLLDINLAQKVLDEDHYNLQEVKERILEYLAVRSLKTTTKGPILCFVGPPGVGKTSLGRSIARAMGRKFIRISLGGMKDEAEIRGHRRTYIGALPGRIIQEICRVEANNPVFMLDEVDKIGQDFRGDPSSALLEVLDPEQNYSFTDHYLDVPFDLSGVMFITTANIMDPVPHPLKDRMEVIHLSGYSDEEKVQIAFKYLIPKQVVENGLEGHTLEFVEPAVLKIIKDYTREAGVRNLERQIASICRKIAKEIAQERTARRAITSADVEDLLGSRKYFSDVAGEEDSVGVVTGLAWTETGGDIIFVEASRMAGKKELTLTGSLGEVMQESAKAAMTFIRAHAEDFGIDPDFFTKSDIHIHVPAGAIPKDGPSAGITIALSLISLLTRRPARRDVAMTGELTLSGRILPIGGVKEKVLAARRAGVTTVLLPERNRENLSDIEENIREEMNIDFVSSLQEVVDKTLLPPRRCTPTEPFADHSAPSFDHCP